MSKAKYKVTNWSEYDKALVKRGNVTVWFDKEEVEKNAQLFRVIKTSNALVLH